MSYYDDDQPRYKRPAMPDTVLAIYRLALKDADTSVREAVVGQVRSYRDPRVIDLLLSVAHDLDPQIRFIATEGLIARNTPRALDVLLTAAGDTNWNNAIPAIRALGKMANDPGGRIRRTLYRILESRPSMEVAAALGARGAAGLALVRQSLRHRNPAVRAAVVEYLGRRKQLTPAQLDAALHDPHVDVRRAALRTIQAATPANFRRFEQAITDVAVMGTAVDAMAFLGSSPVRALVRAMRDSTPGIRMQAIRLLAEYGRVSSDADMYSCIPRWTFPRIRQDIIAQVAQRAVAERLFDANVNVRLAAAEALLSLPTTKDTRTLDAMRHGLSDPDAEVRKLCAEAYRYYQPDRHAVDLLLALLRQPATPKTVEVQVQAALALGNAREPRALDTLLGMLNAIDPRYTEEHPDWAEYHSPSLSMAAGRALRPLAPVIIPALRERVKSDDPIQREAAVTALAISRSPTVADDLRLLLNDPTPKIRGLAAWGLGRLPDPASVDLLRAALKDTELLVQQRAAGGLGDIGDDRAAEDLVALLPTAKSCVRDEIITALLHLPAPHTVDALLALLKDNPRDDDITALLTAFTGRKFTNYEEWNRWWQQARTHPLPAVSPQKEGWYLRLYDIWQSRL